MRQLDYNLQTFFPRSLVGEVVEILRGKDCAFRRFRDFPIPLVHPRLDKYSYLYEYFRFKTRRMGFAKRLVTVLRERLSRYTGLTAPKFQTDETIVILHHDADGQPYKTVDMLDYERGIGVVSSAFFFYKQNAPEDFEPYVVDVERLQAFEREGFEIGYHLNALELAKYDMEAAFEIIERDIDWFAHHFDLRSFVPHGGIPGPNGENNDLIPYRGRLRDFNWCFNRIRLHFDRTWSDGNIEFENLEDPREVAERVRPGERVLFLMHPQYYGDTLSESYRDLPVSRTSWWRDLWRL